jgi:hypothetical protein
VTDAPELDLFGREVMHRSARFLGGGRIELRRRWGPGPTACMIGCNPSDAGIDRDDPTSLWWINWCRLFGFGGYVAVNLYPFVSSSPDECREIVAGIEGGDWAARDLLHFVNLPAVVDAAKAADQVFVCWGAIAWDQVWIDEVVEAIQTGAASYPDLWCWGFTASGAPKHPMARGAHRIPRDQKPILWRPA